MLIKVAAIKCNMCGDTIYSCAPHDFRWCSCHNCYVDGGLSIIAPEEYVSKVPTTRIGWTIKEEVFETVEIIEVPDKANPRRYIGKNYYLPSSKFEYGTIKDPKYTEDDLIAAKAKINLIIGD